MDRTELFLRELTQASGVSGYEDDIRRILKKHLSPLGDISVDRLGSLICHVSGVTDEPGVMLAAHMDQIGFMVKAITDRGFIKFNSLGGWSNQFMMAHRVNILTIKGNVVGTITGPSPDIMTDEERKKPIERKDMYIDIGGSSKKDIEVAGVRIGDPIIPVSDFAVLNVPRKTYMTKAFDDRVGVRH
jgi:endoglucanase